VTDRVAGKSRPRGGPIGPDRTGSGLRARTRRGRIGRTWWSQRWILILEGTGLGDRLHRGRYLARSGSVLSLEVAPGLIQAEVAGKGALSHEVRIGMEPIPQASWEALEHILSRRALFAAKLLAGEMPQPIEDAFAEAGLVLLPASADDLEISCDCDDPQPPCPHLAAVFYLLAERFDEDPFRILLFRGRDRDELLDSIRGGGRSVQDPPRDEPAEERRRKLSGNGLAETLPVDPPATTGGGRRSPAARNPGERNPAQSSAETGAAASRANGARPEAPPSEAAEAGSQGSFVHPEGPGSIQRQAGQSEGDGGLQRDVREDDALRTRQGRQRGDHEDGGASPVGPEPLSSRSATETLASFWDLQADLSQLNPRIQPPVIPEAVIRRLGAPPGTEPDSSTEAALRRAYQLASAWALRLTSREPRREGEAGEKPGP